MLPNDVPTVIWVDQALVVKPKGVDTVFMGDLNARLGEPYDDCEEDLATAQSNHGLEDVIGHFTLP